MEALVDDASVAPGNRSARADKTELCVIRALRPCLTFGEVRSVNFHCYINISARTLRHCSNDFNIYSSILGIGMDV